VFPDNRSAISTHPARDGAVSASAFSASRPLIGGLFRRGAAARGCPGYAIPPATNGCPHARGSRASALHRRRSMLHRTPAKIAAALPDRSSYSSPVSRVYLIEPVFVSCQDDAVSRQEARMKSTNPSINTVLILGAGELGLPVLRAMSRQARLYPSLK